jgi:hypothetical protein
VTRLLLQGDARHLPLADRSVDLVFGSPPYVDARLYLEDGKDLGIARDCLAWVGWMLDVTAEALRVCRGPVLWVAAGKTKDRNYWPACEGLMWEWWQRGGDCQLYRPCYWHRVGIPGSGGKDWFRADVEYVMCFKRPGPLPWSDNTAMGHPPKWAPGGDMSHRMGSGKRVNAHGVRMDGVRIGARRVNGSRAADESPDWNSRDRAVHVVVTRPRDGMHSQESTVYVPPAKANPGNLVKTVVGGNLMGSKLAHENEAPFPESLVEHFIRSLCPPGGIVLDPFSGSATTSAAAVRHGRRAIGLDLRRSQCELGARRLAEPPRAARPRAAPAAPGQRSLFDLMEGR